MEQVLCHPAKTSTGIQRVLEHFCLNKSSESLSKSTGEWYLYCHRRMFRENRPTRSSKFLSFMGVSLSGCPNGYGCFSIVRLESFGSKICGDCQVIQSVARCSWEMFDLHLQRTLTNPTLSINLSMHLRMVRTKHCSLMHIDQVGQILFRVPANNQCLKHFTTFS